VFQLALIYEVGSPPSIQADPAYSLSLLKEACKLDHLPAMYHLGHCYEYGSVVCKPNPVESVYYYRMGASAADAKCQLALAGWFMTGVDQVLPKNERKAYELTKAAAEQNLPKANYTLGSIVYLIIQVTSMNEA
jgi:TPR repeat protein